MNPAPNRDLAKLTPDFRRKLKAIVSDLAGHGVGLAIVEGWRSVARQRYLYEQGRKRPGPIVTFKNGVENKSYHQSGNAADVIFSDGHHRYYPPLHQPNGSFSPEWALLASSAKAHGVTWGGSPGTPLAKLGDTPHLQIP